MLKENILSDLKMSSKSVLEHFTVPDDFQNGNTFKGKCMHCGTLISGSYKVTSNFVTHMKRKHRDLYILHSENKEIQPTLTQCIKKSVKYSPSDPKQLEMTNALIMFIAGDLLPLSIVESEEFKNLMEKADTKYQVPSRKHLSSKLLHEKSVEIKNNLVNTLKRAESVCLTIDLWSSRQMRGFLLFQPHLHQLNAYLALLEKQLGRKGADWLMEHLKS
ncbi:E3 SUMO-protein ligase ZBED1-like [Mytilus trossulus]|uniref:E3 SUMO-protein ligase ZBED1-like n=1 Tax=Mytilus trossulus TaxID=6551 RepID=UPI003006F20B